MGNTLKINPITTVIGAEISDIDLSQTLDAEIQDQIYNALMQHLVLFFRDQDLSPQAQFDFATTFGTPGNRIQFTHTCLDMIVSSCWRTMAIDHPIQMTGTRT